MHISSFQIKNYKGFNESGQIKLTPGFNVVAGQNNAGKTALIEALSLKFRDNLHRSLKTSAKGNSSIEIGLKVEAGEALDFLSKNNRFIIYLRHGESQGSAIDRVQHYFENKFEISSIFTNGSITKCDLLRFQTDQDRGIWATFTEQRKIEASPSTGGFNLTIQQVANSICIDIQQRLYVFRAERLNIHESNIGTVPVLAPDANNLAEVLHLLQSSNRYRFQRFVDDVRTVFPDIQDVAITPISSNKAKINIWFVDPETERQDLAVSLSDCGTGIGQVLAMLYVVINSDKPRTILIDEPQSFLHPGAIQKLFEIFKREQNRKHQYIVTTHSPTVITACSPCNIILLRRENNETKAETIDANETSQLRLLLSEIGARLSDVFGADKILWVEGKTEENCFKKIVEQLLKIELMATEIIGVTNVGDLEGRHKEVVLEIYQKLCKGHGLLPPALGFCFDQEKLSQTEMNTLTQESGGLIQFIPRRMYENYLLNPEGIAAILNESDTEKTADITKEKINEWLTVNRLAARYINSYDHADWGKRVDAAKLLVDLFNNLTETRVRYDKIKHGIKLTDWIIQNSPHDFEELGVFLKKMLEK